MNSFSLTITISSGRSRAQPGWDCWGNVPSAHLGISPETTLAIQALSPAEGLPENTVSQRKESHSDTAWQHAVSSAALVSHPRRSFTPRLQAHASRFVLAQWQLSSGVLIPRRQDEHAAAFRPRDECPFRSPVPSLSQPPHVSPPSAPSLRATSPGLCTHPWSPGQDFCPLCRAHAVMYLLAHLVSTRQGPVGNRPAFPGTLIRLLQLADQACVHGSVMKGPDFCRTGMSGAPGSAHPVVPRWCVWVPAGSCSPPTSPFPSCLPRLQLQHHASA